MSTAHQDAVCYCWDKLPFDHPMALLARRRIIGEQMMISDVHLEKGCYVPMHQHENEQFCLVLSGRLRFDLRDADGKERAVEVGSGEVLFLPSQVPHAATALVDSRVLDLFSPISQATGIDAKS